MNWQQMVKTLDLDTEVREFVAGRVAELVADQRRFHFEGTRHDCDLLAAHAPHVVGHYRTVRYGELQRFCLGREGDTDQGRLHIVVRDYDAGDPAYPGSATGYWFVTGVGESK